MENLKLESGMAKLYELKTEMERSIENIGILKKQYTALSEVVEKSGRKEDFPENFVESLAEYQDNLDKQVRTLLPRLAYIKILIESYEKQDEEAKKLEHIIALAFAALGITNNEEESKEAE